MPDYEPSVLYIRILPQRGGATPNFGEFTFHALRWIRAYALANMRMAAGAKRYGAWPKPRRARGGEREDASPDPTVGLLEVDGPQQPHRVSFRVGAHAAPSP